MASPLTAAEGKVYYGVGLTEVDDVVNITVNRTSEAKAYNSSATAGRTRRLTGNRDSQVTFERLLDDGELNLGFDEGDIITLKAETNTGKFLQGSYHVDSINVTVNVETKEIEKATITASQDGAFSLT